LLCLACLASLLVSAALCSLRDAGYAGPHHDEVIALQAAKALEREYGRLLERQGFPFDQGVPAREWHRFTKGFVPVSWSEIRQDVQAGDKHPPLAFWLFNRWLSLFPYGGYRQAVWLTWLQVVVAGAILAVAVHRLIRGGQRPEVGGQRSGAGERGEPTDHTEDTDAESGVRSPEFRVGAAAATDAAGIGFSPFDWLRDCVAPDLPDLGSAGTLDRRCRVQRPRPTWVAPGRWTGGGSGWAPPTYLYAFALFVAGNAAIFTATWVRQYALFAVFYALTMLLAAELARERSSVRRPKAPSKPAMLGASSGYACASVGLGLACVGGMSTQYTFATMSAPIHLALLGLLVWRREWRRALGLCVAYTGAAVLFLLLNPGAIAHARAVSQGIERRLQFGEALSGIPQMVIPWPSFLPAWTCWTTGAATLGAILALGAYVSWRMATRGPGDSPRITRMDTKGSLPTEHTEDTEVAAGRWTAAGRVQPVCVRTRTGRRPRPTELPTDALTHGRRGTTAGPAVVLAGMLGAGLLQFLLVGLGFYLGWATGPNHLCAFWLLTVFAWGLLLHLHPQRWLRALTALGLIGMVGMQGLYGYHCHQIKPRTNVQYIASEKPDLVYLDNLTRGMVLQVTDIMPPEARVLAASAERLSALLASRDLDGFRRLLYLPMDTSVTESKPQVLDLFRQAGWAARELPVVHPGLYEAVLLTRE
jgi:hypothetical protein